MPKLELRAAAHCAHIIHLSDLVGTLALTRNQFIGIIRTVRDHLPAHVTILQRSPRGATRVLVVPAAGVGFRLDVTNRARVTMR